MILIEGIRQAIEKTITDFARTTSWCERFMRENGLCMCTETTIGQKVPCECERKIRGNAPVMGRFFINCY
jgi:hypothetical protein